MYTFAPEEQENMLDWCAARIPHIDKFDKAQSLAMGMFNPKTRATGVVVFSTTLGDQDMELSWAGHGVWSRENLRAIFDYVYNRHMARRATVIILKRDKKTRELAERLGFRHEGTHPETVGCETTCSYGMLKNNCKWIK